MSGQAKVSLCGTIVFAHYQGSMTAEIVAQAANEIREYLKSSKRSVLFETSQMASPDVKLALFMRNFASEIQPSVVRMATLVPSTATAVMAKVAFATIRSHKVVYNDLDKALDWLNASTNEIELIKQSLSTHARSAL